MIHTTTIDWTAQHEASRQRSVAGGGKPCAVQTTLPVGRSHTTAELSVNIVRSASHKTGPLRAVGTVIHGGRQIAAAEARVEDERAKLYAHATTTCVAFAMRATTRFPK